LLAAISGGTRPVAMRINEQIPVMSILIAACFPACTKGRPTACSSRPATTSRSFGWFCWRSYRKSGAYCLWSVDQRKLYHRYALCIRIVAFNTSEGCSGDVTVDIADELRRRYTEQDDVAESALAFVEANPQRPG
jgi:hypothetical protein